MTDNVITEREAAMLAELRERERRYRTLGEWAAWVKYVKENPEFTARLQEHLDKIPAMVDELEAAGQGSIGR